MHTDIVSVLAIENTGIPDGGIPVVGQPSNAVRPFNEGKEVVQVTPWFWRCFCFSDFSNRF